MVLAAGTVKIGPGTLCQIPVSVDGVTKRYLVSVEGCWRARGVVDGEEVLKPLTDLRQILSKDTHTGEGGKKNSPALKMVK